MDRAYAEPAVETSYVYSVVSNMTLDEKISQMIMPAFRTWNGEAVTDLSDVPALASALQRHQYGGVVLFGENITDTEQVTRLVAAIQENNGAISDVTAHVPYFMAVDQEGGEVVRLADGTRMPGNMAVGASGAHARDNAQATGRVIGEELHALGFNVNFAPDIDVNNNPANPVIGVRSFSDDPAAVAELGSAYSAGLREFGIIPAVKHFPGHGDTAIDSHTGTPVIDKTYEEAKGLELVPFRAAVDDGVEMIMTAHIVFPAMDDEVELGDGVTRGYYPATMSKHLITDVLRGDMGFSGVVVTDALEMEAIRGAGLVPGGYGTAEYGANVAREVIGAGVDILLLPMDLTSEDAVQFYDDYIDALVQMVADGTISEKRIDESVTRILTLKQAYGILALPTSTDRIETEVAVAKQLVGSDEHRAVEERIAREAITFVKNDGETLPIAGDRGNVVILARELDDIPTVVYALQNLQAAGALPADMRIENLATGEGIGSEDASMRIAIDCYFDFYSMTLRYTDVLRDAISEADVVVGMTKAYSVDSLSGSMPQYQGISRAIGDAHDAGAKFVLVSANLPYDAARYQDADAIVLAYMAEGLDVDPTARGNGSGTVHASCANVVAALESLFADELPTGTLPVAIPAIVENGDGSVSFSGEVLYERGFGLTKPVAQPEHAEMTGAGEAKSATSASSAAVSTASSGESRSKNGGTGLPLVPIVGAIAVVAGILVFVLVRKRRK